MFEPNGEIFDEETFRRLLDVPSGMKHSSLDWLQELSGSPSATRAGQSSASLREMIWAST
jgi:hypothetical protein